MSIKNILSFRSKYSIRLFLQRFKKYSYFKNQTLDSDKSYVFIFLAADYGNLGDVAITYAQTKFLKNHLPNSFHVVEIPISQSLEGLQFVKNNIKPGDIVTSVGGGNLGDMYDQIEFIRQLSVKFFPRNKFISFPQTFDFAETASGNKALNIAKKVYDKHPDLHFIAREKTSFELMKKHFTNANILLTPDIVISLDKQKPEKTRKGVVMTMRQDKEKNLSDTQAAFINKEVKKRFDSVTYYDTHINRDQLSLEEREKELNRIWDAFKAAELVVTDRLHGMIFCYITNTPCLVFQNNNHKVRETYEWIKGNSNINLIEEFSKEKIKKFLTKENFYTGSMVDTEENYKPLINLLK